MNPATRIIFLDIDGVLNNHESMVRAALEEKHLVLDPHCVARLQDLVEQTGSKLVLTSTWRLARAGMGMVAHAMMDAGWKGRVPLISKTGREPGGRGQQILDWIVADAHTGPIVILDDDADMGPLLHRLVRTNPYRGLSDDDVEKAARMLAWFAPEGSTTPVL